MIKKENLKPLLIFLVCFIVVVLVLLNIQVGKKENNIILGFNISEKAKIESKIDNFLYDQIDKNIRGTELHHADENKTFFVYKLLGMDNAHIYIWIQKAEYRMIDGTPNHFNASSLPLVLNYKNKNIAIIDYEIPEDGVNAGKSCSTLFPSIIREQFPNNEETTKMQNDLNYKVDHYYNK
jgi:hypothetical protein